MILWCMIAVVLDGAVVHTAVEGKVVKKMWPDYVMDFSEYAAKQGYEGKYSTVIVDQNRCINEKESK